MGTTCASVCSMESGKEPPPGAVCMFLLAGQSNMAGRAQISEECSEEPRILALSRDGKWKTARDPLHDDKPEKAGVGPGLAFARAVVDFCSAPIGLVPCAFGGSEIQRWIADGDLLQSAKGRLQEGEAAGGVLKGILWHQGESDCGSEEMASLYPSRLHQLKQDLQTACGGVPMILGELGMEFLDLEDSRFSFADAVNTSIVEFGTSGGTSIGCVSARGLQHKGDRLHFCRSSAEELGKRYAWKWLEMTGNLNLSLHTLVGDQLSPPFLLTAPRDLDGSPPADKEAATGAVLD
ncbi:Probable carbohydrate esterase At4g34215 [Durusdinium trenchii]|uniref:Probable carbohydrate esterase At4g34215 n=1 Tax=Durusdinium trenchii TaxID=1381693 RepID=A0ABP0QBF0_9DINO